MKMAKLNTNTDLKSTVTLPHILLIKKRLGGNRRGIDAAAQMCVGGGKGGGRCA